MKFDFLIIRDANQGACESDAFADSEMIRETASRRRRRKQDSPPPTARRLTMKASVSTARSLAGLI
ncbi:MAG: hypothetical protein DWI22_08540 [Planctomycetota bacterium]|nr:MAG: hypothetical protein DWI22_08540 [Planctomycetota bacterium]